MLRFFNRLAKIILTFWLLILLLPVTHSQINVRHVDKGFDIGEGTGVFYVLPRTVIQIDLLVDKIIKIKGPYHAYAKKYLGVDHIIENDATTYMIREITLSPTAEPDNDQIYFIEYNERQTKDAQSILLSFTEDGLILGAELISGEVKPGKGFIFPEQEPDVDSLARYFRYFAEKNLIKKVDTLVRKINIDTISIKKLSFRTNIVEKTLEQKAREAVMNIESIRVDRYNILIGYQEVSYSKEAIEYMSGELTKLEDEYLDLFCGKILYQTLRYRYTYTPKPGDENIWIPVLDFSEQKGPQNPGTSDESLYIRFSKSGTTGLFKDITKQKDEEAGIPGGFHYRLPEQVDISVLYRGTRYKGLTTYIAQFGNIIALPPGIQNIKFYPHTGSLKSIQFVY